MDYVNQLIVLCQNAPDTFKIQGQSTVNASRRFSTVQEILNREKIQHANPILLVRIRRDIQSNCAAHKKDQKGALKERARDCNIVPACAGEAARNDRLSSELVQTDKAKAELLSQTHMPFECFSLL